MVSAGTRRRVLFCTITQQAGHGGIARVSSMLWDVIQQQYPDDCEVLTASPSPSGELTAIDKLRFALKVIARQIFGGCDVLFFDHIGLARVQNLVPRALRRPYGVMLYSIEAWVPLGRDKLMALAEARSRIAISHFTAARVAAAHQGIGRIEVCHLALGRNLMDANGSSHSADGAVLSRIRPDSVLVVGRMMSGERHKGHDQMLEAWAFVLRRVPGAQLVIVGRGDDAPRLQQLARELGIAESVYFTGHVDEPTLRAIYGRVAVFAMPSRAEGFGLVYLEAMLNRLPCIGSVHDAAREIIVDGETGYLVNQNAIGELASAMVRLLTDPELRKRLGDKGYERVRSHFSFDQFHGRMARALKNLADT